MLRRICIVLLALACAGPAVAGELKTHGWPYQYAWVDIASMDVIMDVGFYIHLRDQGPIKVYQDECSDDPFRTYVGCKTTRVDSNFSAQFRAVAVAMSPAVGVWTPTVTPSRIQPGTSEIEICVRGRHVKIDRLPGGAKNFKVAEVTLSVLPL